MSLIERRRKRRDGHSPCFIVQRGCADDHYDLRLEIGGVLVSWTLPTEGRIARRAVDHPLRHARRDGAVSDSGTYCSAIPYAMTECLERGYLSFYLEGERLRGCYTLTRIHEGDDEAWLLMRRQEDEPS